MKRVVDLDKFSLEEIWWPYQNFHAFGEKRLSSPPMSLEETAALLRERSEWSQCVIDRLSRIGVTFPRYIVHPLVDAVRDGIADYRRPG